MLERLQSVANWLRPLLPVAVLLGTAGALLFLWAAVAGGTQDDGLLIFGLIATLWGALLFALITGFRHIPPTVDPALPWFRRMRAHLARGAYVLMAWAMLAAAAMAVMMTGRLLTLWWE